MVEAGSRRQPRATWFTPLHSSPARGTCGASKGAAPKGARHGRRTHAAGCRAGQPERRPIRSRMLGECSIRELVASFEEAHLSSQPIHGVHAGWFTPESGYSRGGSYESLLSWPGRVSGNTLARRRSKSGGSKVSDGLVATVPGPRQGNGPPKSRQGVRRVGRDTINCTLDRCVWSSKR